MAENVLCILICIIGLVLSAQLIGNMQTNLQSMTVRVEEWMRHRQYLQIWKNRHLSLALVRRVPFFSQMDDQLPDAICERLVSSLSTEGTCIVREGDPVNEMLFVIRGQLESSTTNGGRSGFFNSITLTPGDFCGEELLTWALMPKSSANLPSSTRTVKA
ncbi:CYCLIC NUCLEOTIDE-GATED ION CHANNEL 15-RELATED-RELATED [Salix purpurea]|uniref:CYCLIC NUCLEOTIDE-GATED ION CHANNEL 15-RELATED-RELATED n=1 Tax=Salix purpurea TaxID=77065 RepID=A0A9Q0W9S6_SALPP|nr:CYCLIC NUCLEOTIDE-GATED ION CHANNEL 15-RELATED-RELATED [Salix purpurea]